MHRFLILFDGHHTHRRGIEIEGRAARIIVQQILGTNEQQRRGGTLLKRDVMSCLLLQHVNQRVADGPCRVNIRKIQITDVTLLISLHKVLDDRLGTLLLTTSSQQQRYTYYIYKTLHFWGMFFSTSSRWSHTI